MKSIGKSSCLVVICCMLALSACAALAEEPEGTLAPEISTELDIAYVNKYVWRGILLNPDPVVQPSLTVSHASGLSFNFWGSMDTTDVVGEDGSFTEIDYTLNYAWTAKKLDMNAGLIRYTFPNTDFASTSEAYAAACFGGTYSPTLSVNYDFEEADGAYLSLAAGYTCPLPQFKRAPSLGLSAKLSWATSDYNEFYYSGADKSAFTDATISASWPMTTSSKMTITPSISYARTLDGDLRDSLAAADLDEDNFYVGVTASSSF